MYSCIGVWTPYIMHMGTQKLNYVTNKHMFGGTNIATYIHSCIMEKSIYSLITYICTADIFGAIKMPHNGYVWWTYICPSFTYIRGIVLYFVYNWHFNINMPWQGLNSSHVDNNVSWYSDVVHTTYACIMLSVFKIFCMYFTYFEQYINI